MAIGVPSASQPFSLFFALYFKLMLLVRDAGIRMRSCFFLGSVTSLRNHIAR